MKKRMLPILKTVLFFTPFILAVIGFKSLNDSTLNAMYRAMRLYIIELDLESYDEMILPIEIARWTAPLMSAAAIITLLNNLFGTLRNWVRIRKGNAIAIHGDSDYVQHMADQLGPRAVLGKNAMAMRAAKHILLFKEDQDMLTYLSTNRDKLFHGDSHVYLCTEHIVRGNYQNHRLVLSNFPEICARKYWAEYPLRLGLQERSIVIIGFGQYGQQLLSQALMTNVYTRDVQITYHVFGDSAEYRGQHTQLHQIATINEQRDGKDAIFFHDEPWYACQQLLTEADRVILVEDKGETNIRTLNAIGKFFVTKDIYVKVDNRAVLEDLWGGAKPFGTADSLYTEKTIIDEDTMTDAIRIHAGYYRDNQCALRATCKDADCLGCRHLQEDWGNLSHFMMYANVTQADHMAVKLQILLGDDFRDDPQAKDKAEATYSALSQDEKLKLLEIEHIRWARYYYMNNWQYDPVRNNEQKKHPLLVPYGDLDPIHQQKDDAAWLNVFELYRDGTEKAV